MSEVGKWIPVADMFPPDGEIVRTKIDDARGCRNEGHLKRRGSLWFLPDGSMYVYYTPTHWGREIDFMKRQIICTKCGVLKPTPSEDVMAGIKSRRLRGKLSLSLSCDLCNATMFLGTEAVAETYWRGSEPMDWESVYFDKNTSL